MPTDDTKKRILFAFDETSLDTLKNIQVSGSMPSMAAAVKSSLQLRETLLEQAKGGFTEIIVRNPATNTEKTVLVPDLLAKKSKKVT